MDKKGKNRKGVMYSTNPDFEYEYENDELETLANNKQNLKVCIDKHRAGKVVIIIKEFVGTTEDLKSLDENTLLAVFEGIPQATISKEALNCTLVDFLSEVTSQIVFSSKGEARRMLKGGGISINKQKTTQNADNKLEVELLQEKYVLIQKGKKNYFLITVE